jgi:hypothetical protein
MLPAAAADDRSRAGNAAAAAAAAAADSPDLTGLSSCGCSCCDDKPFRSAAAAEVPLCCALSGVSASFTTAGREKQDRPIQCQACRIEGAADVFELQPRDFTALGTNDTTPSVCALHLICHADASLRR